MAEPEPVAGEQVVSDKGQPLVRVRRPVGRPPKQRDPVPEVVTPPLTTAGDDLPPDEPDPTFRSTPSIGRIQVTDEGRAHLESEPEPPPAPAPIPDFVEAGAEPRTFDDLMGMFPIGDESGLYYIYVERRSPRSFSGYATQGVLRKIRTRITLEEFKELYGGGDYLLTVYGPPKRKGVLDPRTNLPAPKALTRPVRFTIPWSGAGGHSPNPDATYENEDDQMENSSGHLPGYLPHLMTRGTPAGAKMLETQLSYNERTADRERTERRERRERAQAAERSTIELVTQQAERREAELRQMIRDLTTEIKELKTQKPQTTDFEGLSRVLTTMNPRAQKGEVEALTEGHRRELETQERRHREELESVHRRNNDEMSRVRADARSDVQRTEERVTGIEQRAAERVRDVEAKLDAQQSRARDEREQALTLLRAEQQREIEHVRGEAARNLEVQKIAQETLLATERTSFERELRMRAEIAEQRLVTETSRRDDRVSRLEADARKRDRDVEEFKRLAENNKDLGRLIAEAEKTAKLLGLERQDEGGAAEPMDWKQMLLTAGVEAVRKMPEIIAKAGDSLAAVRLATAGVGGQQQMPPGVPQPQQMQGYREPMMPMPRRIFAAEGSGIEPEGPPPFFHENQGVGMRPSPLAPDPVPHQQQQPMPVGEMVAPVQQQQPVAQAAPAVQAAPALAPHASVPPPAPAAPDPAVPQASPAPKAADHELGNPALDPNVLQAKDDLEKYFRERTPPDAIVKALIDQYGVAVVRAVQPTVSVDVVVGALTRAGHTDSRLLGYKGRRFLKAVEEALERALRAVAA